MVVWETGDDDTVYAGSPERVDVGIIGVVMETFVLGIWEQQHHLTRGKDLEMVLLRRLAKAAVISIIQICSLMQARKTSRSGGRVYSGEDGDYGNGDTDEKEEDGMTR